MQRLSRPTLVTGCVLGALACPGWAVDLVVFDAAQFNANGFTFDDFGGGAVDTSGGFLDIDVMTDLDSANGLFGGMGSDVAAFFDVNDAQFEITLTPDPLNAASAFRVTLRDDDGSGTADEHVFEFDLTGLTPGVQTTITQPLNLGPLFTQGAFNFFPGDGVQNYDDAVGAGLTQIQIQSVFDVPDRLKLQVESLKIVDPNDPTIFNFTPATQSAQPGNFDFGTFQDPGAVDTTNGNFVINSTQAGEPEPAGGGIGFSGSSLDFDAEEAKLVVEAKLLPGNTATGFDIILNDLDGDDSGPGLGSDEYFFTFDTADFNENDFATVELQLGSGSETGVRNTFGFTNGGDGIQNFDLAGMQIQALEEDSTLAIEIIRATIVESILAVITGDYDGSGQVEQGDLDIVLQNWGTGTFTGDEAALVGGGPFDGTVDQNELDGVLQNWGSTAAPDFAGSAVPEPATLVVLGAGGLGALRRRHA